METERVRERRAVEGRGHARAPVHDDRPAALILDVPPADVPACVVVVVDATEAERAGLVVERVEPPLELPLHRLGIGLVGGEDVLGRDPGGGLAAHPLEAVLRVPQARALERDVRVGHFAHVSQAESARAPDFGVAIRRAPPISCEIPAHFVRLIAVTNPPGTRSARSVG